MGTANYVPGFQSNGFWRACLANIILPFGELALLIAKLVSRVLMWVSEAWFAISEINYRDSGTGTFLDQVS